jgi:hypothetical protein
MSDFELNESTWKLLMGEIRDIKAGVNKINGRVRRNEMKIAAIGGGLVVLGAVIGLVESGILHL